MQEIDGKMVALIGSNLSFQLSKMWWGCKKSISRNRRCHASQIGTKTQGNASSSPANNITQQSQSRTCVKTLDARTSNREKKINNRVHQVRGCGIGTANRSRKRLRADLDFDLLSDFSSRARARRSHGDALEEVTRGITHRQAIAIYLLRCVPPRTWCSGCSEVRRPDRTAKKAKDAEGEFANGAVFTGVLAPLEIISVATGAWKLTDYPVLSRLLDYSHLWWVLHGTIQLFILSSIAAIGSKRFICSLFFILCYQLCWIYCNLDFSIINNFNFSTATNQGEQNWTETYVAKIKAHAQRKKSKVLL